ncbi:ABC transporter ATP-binding protein [Microbacterium sp. Root53]|uniref:ATP-binding cassette domain-containing protein n=1 Tax=Microbacterium sp. Root53 TaxID=1736553 RepID=UPI0006FDFEAF|nr:ABC transporter ATP-binding protein [Microbacterium sp. Root53]KQY99201.1 ABC transporter ATP-binding protein [Microbacterium sp. Root53]
MTTPLLSVRGLRVRLGGADVLRGVDLEVAPGECLAVVGESGAGKSVLARTLLGLTRRDGAGVAADVFDIAGRDARRLPERAWRALRGADVSLVLQDALQSLDPLRTIGAEVGETLAVRGVPRAERRSRVLDALDAAGLPLGGPARVESDARLRQRPGQLSGGMRQRALIASAVVGGARLIVADEPTTALDATTAVRVLGLLGRLRDEGTGLLLITHDLSAVARVADRIAVIDGGRIVEHGSAEQVLHAPAHPATRALLAAAPTGPKPTAAAPGGPVIEATGLVRRYPGPSGAFAAVDGVDVSVRRGEVLGVVGESGSGKTTLARLLTGLERPDAGEVHRAEGARMRLVPQDPLGSFDPRHTVERILRLARRGAAPSPTALLERVGLDPAAVLRRRPASLSGGQRQRVAIARALAADPDVLVCDEPVSALDVTTQSGILDLLLDLQRTEGLAIVFISHDLAVVRRVSDRVAVMRHGVVVEEGGTESVFGDPQHAFTRDLVAAALG